MSWVSCSLWPVNLHLYRETYQAWKREGSHRCWRVRGQVKLMKMGKKKAEDFWWGRKPIWKGIVRWISFCAFPLSCTSPRKCTFSCAKMFAPFWLSIGETHCCYPPSLQQITITYQNTLLCAYFLLGFFFHFIAIIRFFFNRYSWHNFQKV